MGPPNRESYLRSLRKCGTAERIANGGELEYKNTLDAK